MHCHMNVKISPCPGPEYGQVAGTCEGGNESSDSIKCEEISWLAEDQLASQEWLGPWCK